MVDREAVQIIGLSLGITRDLIRVAGVSMRFTRVAYTTEIRFPRTKETMKHMGHMVPEAQTR